MDLWKKRFLRIGIVLVWLVFISIPFLMFFLAARGELKVGSQPGTEIRVFLLQEVDAEGIGWEWSRPRSFDDRQCTQTSVRYMMWAGEPENVTFCQCQNASGEALPVSAESCRAP